jgi:broad specificity phosphatase PhoE
LQIVAYLMRHGSTAISPKPEGWLPIGLSREGWGEAQAGAEFLEQFIRGGAPKPTWGISSDLPRAEQTLAIAADTLGIPTLNSLPRLRAFEDKQETPAQYETRTLDGVSDVLATAQRTNSVPLIVAHRSTTGFLGKHFKAWVREPDYRYDALLLEGGLLAITDCGLLPLFRYVEKNWPEHMKCLS